MFCSKTNYRKIKQIQKRGLRIVSNEPHVSLVELLTRNQGITVHCKHLNILLTETYKTTSGKNSCFMENFFPEKRCKIQFKVGLSHSIHFHVLFPSMKAL